jgi:hypothetical protein
LRSFYDVGVGHDVAVGINDDTGADSVLANDEGGLSAVFFAEGAISGDKDLDYRRRNFGGEAFESFVELGQGLAG